MERFFVNGEFQQLIAGKGGEQGSFGGVHAIEEPDGDGAVAEESGESENDTSGDIHSLFCASRGGAMAYTVAEKWPRGALQTVCGNSLSTTQVIAPTAICGF